MRRWLRLALACSLRLLTSGGIPVLLLAVGGMVQGADLNTTNRDCLAHFWAAAEQTQRPLKILSFGDSMADSYRSITWSLFTNFQAHFGFAGAALNNYANTLLLNFTNGAGFVPLSRFWFTSHAMIPPGGAIYWENYWVPGGLWSDGGGIFYVAHPGGGPLTISVSTNGGPWSPLLTVDGFAPSPVGRYANLDLSLDYHRLRVESLAGTNYVIGAQLQTSHTRGFVAAFADQPGISLADVTNVPVEIRGPIFQALAPDLLIWHMKEDSGDTLRERMLECEHWWSNALPNTDVLYIGTPWVSADATGTVTLDQNTVVRSVALEHRRAYVDCMNPAVSYEWMYAQGFMADVTHPNASGSQYLADLAWNDLGFFAAGAPRRLSITPGENTVRVEFATAAGLQYVLESSSDARQWQESLSLIASGQAVSTNLPKIDPMQFFRLRLQPR